MGRKPRLSVQADATRPKKNDGEVFGKVL